MNFTVSPTDCDRPNRCKFVEQSTAGNNITVKCLACSKVLTVQEAPSGSRNLPNLAQQA